MNLLFEFGAECCTLLPFLGLGVLVILDRVASPQPRELDPINDNHSQFERTAVGMVSVASRASVTPPTRETKGSPKVSGLFVSRVRHNPGSGQVLDPANSLRPGRMADAKATINGAANWRQAISKEPDSNCRGIAASESTSQGGTKWNRR